MKYVISKDTVEVDYKDKDFWQQFDELEVESPEGWYIRFVEGGIVHTFDYCQSTGRGDFIDQYVEHTYEKPLAFSADAKANAEIMKKTDYSRKQAALIRKD